MNDLDPVEFVQYYEQNNMKFWNKKRGKHELKMFQLLEFFKNELCICKVQVHESTHLAVKIRNRVELVDDETIAQRFIKYVQENFPDDSKTIEKIEILDLLVEQSSSYYKRTVLNHLPIHEVNVKPDTKDTCYLLYENGLLVIESEKVYRYLNSQPPIPVFENRKVPRNFVETRNKLKGDYFRFVWNLSGHSLYRFKVFCSALGYLIHNYKDPANPKMVILIDQVIGELELANGGSGKSLFFKGVGHIRNLVELSGKKLQSSSRFAFQRVDLWTDVILVNDASKSEKLENWYNVTADGFMTKKKYEKEVFIPHHLSPKIGITSNHMINRPEGNSSERRVHEIEVSDYYGAHRNPQDEFKRSLFGEEWTEEDWIEFDNFIVFCIQYYLKVGLLEPEKINILKRKLISEVGIELIEFMDEKIKQGTTKFHKKDTYDEFVKGGFINGKYTPQRNTFTRKLKKYFKYKELEYTEIPSDSKKYFQLITKEGIEEETTQTLKDKQVNYKLVDTDNKLNRLNKNLKNNTL